jgi:integration host factor subunit alpha
MTLTKSIIIESIEEQLKCSRKKSTNIVETLFEIIKRSLESGDNVMVSGFGKFCVNEKGKRKGRNPATGEDLILNARNIVTFKCSGVLRKKINGE